MQQAICKQCGRPLTQQHGHRPRLYCRAACKQRRYRLRRQERQHEAFRARWSVYCQTTQFCLEYLLRSYGEEAIEPVLQILEQSHSPASATGACTHLHLFQQVEPGTSSFQS